MKSVSYKGILKSLDQQWSLSHGCTDEISADLKSDTEVFKNWVKNKIQSLIEITADRHNKDG